MLSRRLPNLHQLIKPTNARNILTITHSKVNKGKRVEGENNMKKHFDPISLAPSSHHSEFDPRRIFRFPVDPKSNPNDYAPCEFTSGDYNRSGMRTTEYSCVDTKEEPYSPPGGEHRYGGIKRYEWSVEMIVENSWKKWGKDG
jgi:hypothetical protein